MINAAQHSIICETLTIWAAEFAAGFPSVHETIYDILSMLALEFEACSSVAGTVSAAMPAIEEAAAECEEISAELVSLEPAMGLAGAIVPVAGIRTAELDSSTVFRCRVPHWGITDYLGLHRGCTVILSKSMGKSPELASCRETGRHAGKYSPLHGSWYPPDGFSPEIFRRPELCPFCGKSLVCRQDIHGVIACVNPECRTQIGDRLVRFVTVGGMGIPGITEGVVEQLLMEGKLDTVEGLYSLTVKDFMDACHVSYTDAYMMVKSVERSKLKPLHMLLDAIGIPGLSREASPMMAMCISRAGGMGSLVAPEPRKAAQAAARLSAIAVKAGFSGKAVQCVLDCMFRYRDMVSKFAELGVAQEAAPVDIEGKQKRPRGKKIRRRKPRGESGGNRRMPD